MVVRNEKQHHFYKEDENDLAEFMSDLRRSPADSLSQTHRVILLAKRDTVALAISFLGDDCI